MNKNAKFMISKAKKRLSVSNKEEIIVKRVPITRSQSKLLSKNCTWELIHQLVLKEKCIVNIAKAQVLKVEN
jgi:hypothetical protein